MRLPFCDHGISCIGGLTPQTPCVASLRRCLDSASVLFQAFGPPSSILCSYISPRRGRDAGAKRRNPIAPRPDTSQRASNPLPVLPAKSERGPIVLSWPPRPSHVGRICGKSALEVILPADAARIPAEIGKMKDASAIRVA